MEETLKEVRTLARHLQQSSQAASSVSELGYTNLFEVSDQSPEEVRKNIELVACQAVASILDGRGLAFTFAQRGSATNVQFVPELDRNYLEYKAMKRQFADSSQVKRTTMMTRLMQLVHELAKKNIHSTKRDLFYADVKLFEKQQNSDAVLEELSLMFGCTRHSLQVTASEKGLVVGRLQFNDDDDFIDCTKMGRSGKNIPSFLDRPAEFILLVEKDAAFQRLAEDRFYNTYPCVIITGKGEADLATRMFLRRVKDALKIPILGLFDSDAHGLKILSVYMQGSEAMSHDSANLATPDIKWLGVRPSDLDKYNVPRECRLELTTHDVSFAESLKEKPYIQKRSAWVKELETLLSRKEKAEIQAFTSKGFQYLTQEYLPRKLREGDWV
ncbi:Spo11-3/Rhl2/Bin5/Top6A3 vegetative topoisomerase VIA [Guillardia theta CCMP2712]|uniref:DNA topoisomerase (ATP-hydrolyzing) n=1 Tax=Guillardia theta (strain CCMP2712) TaxID=905079 RepID=L1ITV4_GUITC|nr:Spo11-3/Rhl2/Bin5/Top6A3 vegetative topoisomerase VIA [Guillardia theta CCMP2712]EKX39294.1 Spo11-3/Rhl2/Bin5/Top6A3 vegetative topoisomerase VIA [Guillardia theta CCMP2712]|eukprot:XP_005826274.1 Spo11-3/Rhl2/Bin5/Top6A3 vegetative topoisomerase VIA [Guillardia theta CCMP2712]